MKIGIRKPSVKKSVKARTTGKINRKLKRSVNPFYGKKGIGYITDPEQAIKNKIYHKVTIDPLEGLKKRTQETHKKEQDQPDESYPVIEHSSKGLKFLMVLFYFLGIAFGAAFEALFLAENEINTATICLSIICFALFVLMYKRTYE